jgi:hypothetical protein
LQDLTESERPLYWMIELPISRSSARMYKQ